MDEMLESLLSDIKKVHTSQKLSIYNDKLLIELYSEGSSNSGFALELIECQQNNPIGEYRAYGYAIKNKKTTFNQLEHVCNSGQSTGYMGALLFADNVIRFTEDNNSSINFTLIPQLMSAINKSEQEMGITNSKLKNNYFTILSEELDSSLSTYKNNDYTSSSSMRYSIKSVLTNLLNLELSNAQNNSVIKKLQRLDYLALIRELIPMVKNENTGYTALGNTLDTLDGYLTKKAEKLGIVINQPTIISSQIKKAKPKKLVKINEFGIVEQEYEALTHMLKWEKSEYLRNHPHSLYIPLAGTEWVKAEDGHITEIKLGFVGIINNQISKLPYLEKLSFNNISGFTGGLFFDRLPPQILGLKKLKQIEFRRSKYWGMGIFPTSTKNILKQLKNRGVDVTIPPMIPRKTLVVTLAIIGFDLISLGYYAYCASRQ